MRKFTGSALGAKLLIKSHFLDQRDQIHPFFTLLSRFSTGPCLSLPQSRPRTRSVPLNDEDEGVGNED
jgi:hypothetical protein